MVLILSSQDLCYISGRQIFITKRCKTNGSGFVPITAFDYDWLLLPNPFINAYSHIASGDAFSYKLQMKTYSPLRACIIYSIIRMFIAPSMKEKMARTTFIIKWWPLLSRKIYMELTNKLILGTVHWAWITESINYSKPTLDKSMNILEKEIPGHSGTGYSRSVRGMLWILLANTIRFMNHLKSSVN